MHPIHRAASLKVEMPQFGVLYRKGLEHRKGEVELPPPLRRPLKHAFHFDALAFLKRTDTLSTIA